MIKEKILFDCLYCGNIFSKNEADFESDTSNIPEIRIYIKCPSCKSLNIKLNYIKPKTPL